MSGLKEGMWHERGKRVKMDQESYEPDTGTIPLTVCKTQPHSSAIFSLAFVSYGWLAWLLKAGINLKCRMITDHNAYPLFYISRVFILYTLSRHAIP